MIITLLIVLSPFIIVGIIALIVAMVDFKIRSKVNIHGLRYITHDFADDCKTVTFFYKNRSATVKRVGIDTMHYHTGIGYRPKYNDDFYSFTTSELEHAINSFKTIEDVIEHNNKIKESVKQKQKEFDNKVENFRRLKNKY